MTDDDFLAEVSKKMEAEFLLGQAVGILMERNNLEPRDAVACLEEQAHLSGVFVVEMARLIVHARRADSAAEPTPLRTVRQVEIPPVAHALSERERQVLALIACGATNDDIAEELYLGINTVKTYIRTAYRKIGVTRRSQAVLWGVQNGLSA